jgi:hypothetical protein
VHQIFSPIGDVKYAFSMSAVLTSKSLSAAKVNAILTDSLEATLAYVIVPEETLLMCPPASRRAFR